MSPPAAILFGAPPRTRSLLSSYDATWGPTFAPSQVCEVPLSLQPSGVTVKQENLGKAPMNVSPGLKAEESERARSCTGAVQSGGGSLGNLL